MSDRKGCINTNQHPQPLGGAHPRLVLCAMFQFLQPSAAAFLRILLSKREPHCRLPPLHLFLLDAPHVSQENYLKPRSLFPEIPSEDIWVATTRLVL